MSKSQISARQCVAARGLLGWSQTNLAAASGVSKGPIADFERGKSLPQARTMRDLITAFEAAGVVFISVDEASEPNGEGVRLAK
jgi:transcriptional regulator with XRE-family HTH domain